MKWWWNLQKNIDEKLKDEIDIEEWDLDVRNL
jgi:hypothetical protein